MSTFAARKGLCLLLIAALSVGCILAFQQRNSGKTGSRAKSSNLPPSTSSSSSSSSTTRQSMAPSPSLPHDALSVPLFRQSTSYTCGVASLQSILYYFDVYEGREDTLATMCNTTSDDGTHPTNIVAVANSFPNISAYMKTESTLEDLRRSLESGVPVILDLQAWHSSDFDDDDAPVDWVNDWEDGHYVVLVGMDSNYIYIMDPSTGAGYAYVPVEEFLQRWHDYTIEEDGSRQDYVHLGIFVKGPAPISSYPVEIEYMA